MVYTDAEYIDAVEFEDRDVDLRCMTKKIVVTRKAHPCAFGDLLDQPHEIPPKTRTVRESGIIDDEWGACYCCLDCIGSWLDRLNDE